MTAPTLPALLCPECQDATRKHDDIGCRVDGCFCGQTRATLAAALDELPAPMPAFVEPTDSPAGAVDAAAGVAPRQPEHDLPGTNPAPVGTGHEAAELFRGGSVEAPGGQPAAEALTPVSAAGTDDLVQLGIAALAKSWDDGDDTDEGFVRAVLDALAAAGRLTQDDGQLLGRWVSWWCPVCRDYQALPTACCGTALIRARITARKEPVDA